MREPIREDRKQERTRLKGLFASSTSQTLSCFSPRWALRAIIMQTTSFKFGSHHGTVYCADAADLLHSIGENSADIVFLDPPFNLGKRYSEKHRLDHKPVDEYHEWLFRIVDLSSSILKPGGALFVYHLPLWAMRLGAHAERSLTFRHWISVTMKNGFARGKKLYPAHYALLYFTKGHPQYFSRPKLDPARCRSCGEYIRDYGGYREIIEKSGINLSDVWDDLSPVRHKNRKYRVANELPMELFDRIMIMSGNAGMTYVDPFAGSGSGAVSAVRHQLNFAVGDILKENTEIIVNRLNATDCT